MKKFLILLLFLGGMVVDTVAKEELKPKIRDFIVLQARKNKCGALTIENKSDKEVRLGKTSADATAILTKRAGATVILKKRGDSVRFKYDGVGDRWHLLYCSIQDGYYPKEVRCSEYVQFKKVQSNVACKKNSAKYAPFNFKRSRKSWFGK
jgi:hypothetical protein